MIETKYEYEMCPECCGCGEDFDYKTRTIHMCLRCEGTGLVPKLKVIKLPIKEN